MSENINEKNDITSENYIDSNPTFSINHHEEEMDETPNVFSQPPDFEEMETLKKENKNSFFSNLWPAGSLLSSIINLSIMSLGMGSLAIPQKISYISLVFGIIFIILSGIASLWSFKILGDMSQKYKITKYEEIVKFLFGNGLSIFLSIIICINQIGIIIIYQVVLYKLTGGVINELGKFGYMNVETFAEESFWGIFWVRLCFCYGVAILILFPLCQLKNISKMRYASTLGIISLFILIIIIVAECPFYIKKNIIENEEPINYYDIIPSIENMKIFQSVINMLYIYGCHPGIFPVLESLSDPSPQRINKLFNYSILIDIICYLIIGIFGYLTQPIDTPDLIIERNKIFDNDIFMSIGLIFFLFTIIVKICVNYNTLRYTILNLLNYKTDDFPYSTNLTITGLVLIFSTLISVIFQSISSYISLLGSFCTVIISFFIPGLIYIKGNEFSMKHYNNILALIFICFIVAYGLWCGILTIKDLFF